MALASLAGYGCRLETSTADTSNPEDIMLPDFPKRMLRHSVQLAIFSEGESNTSLVFGSMTSMEREQLEDCIGKLRRVTSTLGKSLKE